MKKPIKTILYNVFIKYQLLFVLLIAIDQITKYLSVHYLESNTVNIIGEWCQLHLIYNDGVAFSLLSSWPGWILASVSIIAVIGIEYYLIVKKPKDKIMYIGLIILAAGAFGNAIDRWLMVFNKLDGVIDFISVDKFATFNVADIYVTLTCIGLLIYFLFSNDESEPSMKELREASKKLDANGNIIDDELISDATPIEDELDIINDENKNESEIVNKDDGK